MSESPPAPTATFEVEGLKLPEKLLYEVAMNYFPRRVLEHEYGLEEGTLDRLLEESIAFRALVERYHRSIDDDEETPALKLRARVLAKKALDTCDEIMRELDAPLSQRLKAAQLVLSAARMDAAPQSAKLPTLVINTNLNMQEREVRGSYTIEARPTKVKLDDDTDDLL